jgi:hypothetical protein
MFLKNPPLNFLLWERRKAAECFKCSLLPFERKEFKDGLCYGL